MARRVLLRGSMSDFITRRPRLRLPLSTYFETDLVFSITACTAFGQSVFADPVVAEAAVRALLERQRYHRVPIYAYCVLPDRLHLLLSASHTCDVVRFVGEVKNHAQRAAWKLGVDGAIWQKSFADHALGWSESRDAYVRHIVEASVRAGLVRHADEYRFAGAPSLLDAVDVTVVDAPAVPSVP